jgi:uncharacterized protein with NAD-binding domain and iron-sulfur cluster
VTTSGDGRLIILGGGIAGLTTAFYASEPDHEKVFPRGIHVYESTDRLGGKGASARHTSKHVRDRIEEHGLHVWFGFYDNAFALLDRCHEYLNKQSEKHHYERWATSLRDVSTGFRPSSRLAVMDHDGSSWVPWVTDFPEDASARPWQVRPAQDSFSSPPELAMRALRLAESFLYSLTGAALSGSRAFTTLLDSSLLPVPIQLPSLSWLTEPLNRLLKPSLVSADGIEPLSHALALVAGAARQIRNLLDEPVRQHNGIRRTWYMVDLLLAAVRGLIDDGVISSGSFESIDELDLRAWLVLHGASQESVGCGLLKAIVYDLAFAYEEGDPTRPSFSAATGVYGLLRLLLTYRGAIMWKMNAGMGEIVFAPIYEALLHRGVIFHFGHEVEKLHLVPDGKDRVRARGISFKPSCIVSEGTKLETLPIETGPLAGNLPYWRDAEPRAEKTTPAPLDIGKHDMIVYGLPVGTIRDVITKPPPRWMECATEVKTVATAAVQLWLNAPVERYAPWATPDLTVGGFTEPFDTWSDMKTLSGEQGVGSGPAPLSVAYFTNVAPDEVEKGALEKRTKTFRVTVLKEQWTQYDDQSMVQDSYVRLNNAATSRYTLSLPGTMKARLSPRDQTICNVRPVGDWTRNIINGGCSEAAVISGMVAASVLRPDRDLTILG